MPLLARLSPICIALALLLVTACGSSGATAVAPGPADSSAPAPEGEVADSGAATPDTGPDAVAADGGVPVEAGADGSSSLSAADFEVQLAKLNCAFQVRCGFLGSAEESACEAAVDAARGVPLPYSEPLAASAGRLHFDPQAAAACLAKTTTKGCTGEQQLAAGAACDAVFSGTVANGSTCEANLECASGYCARARYARDGCPGTCTAYLATGVACDPSLNRCAPGDYCDGASKKCAARSGGGGVCGASGPFCLSGLSCVGTTCKSGGAVGDACAFGLFGSSCTPGLYCDASGSSPTCASRGGVGIACASFDACRDGLDCVGITFDPNTGALTTKGACEPYLDVSSPCDPALAESGCPGGTKCDTMRTCGRVGLVGSRCGGATDPDCRDGLYCDGSPGACAPRTPVGGACLLGDSAAANPCYAATQCDGASSLCTLICQ